TVSSQCPVLLVSLLSHIIHLPPRSTLFPYTTLFRSVRLDASWTAVVLSLALNILAYYVIGWLIGAGFYRFGIGGVLFILLALAWLLATEAMLLLWEAETLRGMNVVPNVSVPALATLILLGVALWIVRMTTKRVRVRL